MAFSLIREQRCHTPRCPYESLLRLTSEIILNRESLCSLLSTMYRLVRYFVVSGIILASLTTLVETYILSASPGRSRQSGSLSRSQPRWSGVILQADRTEELRRGGIVKHTIRGGETQSFSLALLPGQYAQLSAQWRGVDLEVSITKPDGKPLFEGGARVSGPGPTFISIMADMPGLYKIQVKPFEPLSVTGNYELKMEDVRAPVPADEDRCAAQEALVMAQHQKSKELAVEKYEEAIRLWRKADDVSGEADALRGLANLYKAGGEPQKAVDNYNQALALWRRNNNPQDEAYLLIDIGAVYQRLASPEKALDFYKQALPIFQKLDDHAGEALADYSIGLAYAMLAKTQDAIKFYESALPIYQSEKDRLGEARTLNAVAGMYGRTGESEKALNLLQQAATARRELNDRVGEGIALNNIGLIYDNWGDWQQARQNYNQALSIYKSLLKNGWESCREATDKEVNICSTAAQTLANLGELYSSLGDPQSALEIFQESLSIRQILKQPRGLGSTHVHICYAEFLQGRYEDAADSCTQALNFNREAADHLSEASTLTVLGLIYSAQNEPQKALEYYDQALRIQTEAADRRTQAITLDKMGNAYASAHDMKNALESYNRALERWREAKDRDGESITLYGIASAERARGNLMEAHQQIEKALQIIESQRVNLTSAQLRTAYFANRVNYYEMSIDLKMQLGKSGDVETWAAAALETNERARARHLLDILNEARVGLKEDDAERQGSFDPKMAEMLAHKLALERKLNEKAKIQTSLLGSKRADEQSASLSKEISEITNEYDEVEAQIKIYNPRYAALARPQPLTAKEIQQQLLDENTLLLEYALGDEHSYLWAVTPTSIKSYELAKRSEIEKVAGRIKDILASCRKLPGELGSSYQARLAEAEAQYRSEAASLGRMLLEPVAAQLGHKRLIIVAEGNLQYIPFGGLPAPVTAASSANQAEPKSPDDADAPVPLILDHEIISLPSASVLALIRSEMRQRQPAPKAVAVLADPVFERDDPRLPAARSKTGEGVKQREAKSSALGQALRDFDVFNDNLRLPRLYSSRQEATDIIAAAPPDGRFEAIDFKASRATATDPRLAQYRIVHFATHGLLDDRHPELSGIVLSLFDERGRPQEDGFLRLHDIYNLRLPVELVVLSACQTGLGKQVKGEGLIGLTRGFMYAGAARVVASLWKVDDAATADLMKRFYIGMFKDKMTPAAALRAAQVSMWRQPRWHNPYFWSGFILQGEWR